MLILEGILEFDNPCGTTLDKNISLGLDMPNLVLVQHLNFFHLLHCYNFSRFFISAYSYFSESTSSNNLQQLKIIHRDLFPSIIIIEHVLVSNSMEI